MGFQDQNFTWCMDSPRFFFPPHFGMPSLFFLTLELTFSRSSSTTSTIRVQRPRFFLLLLFFFPDRFLGPGVCLAPSALMRIYSQTRRPREFASWAPSPSFVFFFSRFFHSSTHSRTSSHPPVWIVPSTCPDNDFRNSFEFPLSSFSFFFFSEVLSFAGL